MPQMKFKLWLPVLLAAVLAACSQSHQAVEAPAATNSAVPSQSAQAAEKLGTGWGDEVESPVHSVDLRRVSQEPLAQSVLKLLFQRLSRSQRQFDCFSFRQSGIVCTR